MTPPRTDKRSWGKHWTWRDAGKWAWQNLLPLGALVLAFIAVKGNEGTAEKARDLAVQNTQTLQRVEREGAERRDQTCAVAEAKDREEVTRLIRTYNYLVDLPPVERQSALNRAIFAQLPETERDAETTSAPKFCQEPGVGLPKDKRKVPERPAVLIGH